MTLPPFVQELLLRLSLLLALFVVVWIVQRLIRRLLFAPLEAWVENFGSDYGKAIFHAIRRPVRLTVFALAMVAGVTLLNADELVRALANLLARVGIVAAITITIYNLIGLIGFSSDTLEQITGIVIESRLLPFLRTIAQTFVLIIGTLIVLQDLGIDVTGLIASLGVIGLAFSLAARDTAANIFGFTAIVGDNLFEVGDYIVAAGVEGVVEKVGVRSTRLRRLDQSIVAVPNGLLAAEKVANWTRLGKRRLDFLLNVDEVTNSEQMKALTAHIRAFLQARPYEERESVVVSFFNYDGQRAQIRVLCYVRLRDWNAFTLEREQINLGLMDILGQFRSDPQGFVQRPRPASLPPRPSDFPNQANDTGALPPASAARADDDDVD
jgi:MscS family membrane protein